MGLAFRPITQQLGLNLRPQNTTTVKACLRKVKNLASLNKIEGLHQIKLVRQ